VTGGAGFIGSHLVDLLLARGAAVTVLDDLSTGRRENVAHLEGEKRLTVLVASAADRELVEREVPRHDVVFHLASAVGVRLVVEHPVRAVENTFETTGVVLRACARHRRPVLITSSSEVYGKCAEVPFREDGDVVMGATEKRRWAYACAKALDEFLALAHFHETRLPVYIARLFNTVGPRQSSQYGMVLPTFVGQALRGEPVTVHGDGSQRRCFSSVHDVVEGLVKLVETPPARGVVVNLGSREEVTIDELARRVVAVTGSGSEVVHVPYEQVYGAGFDDMLRRVPDLARAERLIGWRASHSLDGIIAEVADFMRASTT
jgi:UDP-glucose 4-epimerase